jgi:hypothetical protein
VDSAESDGVELTVATSEATTDTSAGEEPLAALSESDPQADNAIIAVSAMIDATRGVRRAANRLRGEVILEPSFGCGAAERMDFKGYDTVAARLGMTRRGHA